MAFSTPTTLRFPQRGSATSSRCAARRAAPSMVATSAAGAAKTTQGSKLSTRARDLIGYLRAHKSIFDPGAGFKSQQITLCRKNDTGRMFIPADELETNRRLLPGVQVAEFILAQKDVIVQDAAAVVYAKDARAGSDPSIVEIVVHDLYYMLRVVSYAIAVGSLNFIHENNLGMMKTLHAEVGILPAAMTAGISHMAATVAAAAEDADVKQSTVQCFKVVEDFMAL